MPVEDKLAAASAFFGGGHELVIGRRHFIDGAELDNELCSSGTLTPDEHYQYFRFTIDAVRDIYLSNRYVRYVAVFQNWLAPAGASFDHLHKQLVAIDDRGVYNEMEIRLARANPNIYNEAAVNFAAHRNLVFAENDGAIAFAGFGHRFPTLEIYSKAARSQPWNHSAEQLRSVSDLVHACHAAMGSGHPLQRGMALQAARRRRADALAGADQVAHLQPRRLRGRHPHLRQYHRSRGPARQGAAAPAPAARRGRIAEAAPGRGVPLRTQLAEVQPRRPPRGPGRPGISAAFRRGAGGGRGMREQLSKGTMTQLEQGDHDRRLREQGGYEPFDDVGLGGSDLGHRRNSSFLTRASKSAKSPR